MCKDAYVILDHGIVPWSIIMVDNPNDQIIFIKGNKPEFDEETEKRRDEWAASLIN